MAIDESTEYGNVKTANWKAARGLSKSLRWFWMMTGTPGGPLSVYGQAKLMNPNNVPSREKLWRLQTMTQITEYKWVPKPDADEQMLKAMGKAVRYKREDVFKDLPEQLIIPMFVPLHAKAKSLIKFLEDDGAATVNGFEISPANAAVLAGKVLAISSGSVRSDAGDQIRVPMDEKVALLLQLMSETPGKTIVFGHFTESIRHLRDELQKAGLTVGVIYGDTPIAERDNIIDAFQNGDEMTVVIAHPKTTAVGVELSRADTIVFYGAPMISPFLYTQALARPMSQQQTATQIAVYQLSSLEIETRMFQNLDSGRAWETGVSDMFRAHVEDGADL